MGTAQHDADGRPNPGRARPARRDRGDGRRPGGEGWPIAAGRSPAPGRPLSDALVWPDLTALARACEGSPPPSTSGKRSGSGRSADTWRRRVDAFAWLPGTPYPTGPVWMEPGPAVALTDTPRIGARPPPRRMRPDGCGAPARAGGRWPWTGLQRLAVWATRVGRLRRSLRNVLPAAPDAGAGALRVSRWGQRRSAWRLT
jgi:hypothetical protein